VIAIPRLNSQSNDTGLRNMYSWDTFSRLGLQIDRHFGIPN